MNTSINSIVLALGRICLLAMLFFVITVGSATATIPKRINFQAVLTNSTGEPLADQTVDLIFEIFDAETGGNSMWGPETITDVPTDADGMVHVTLGESISIEPDSLRGNIRYLEIKINSDPPIDPRTRLLSVPFAMHAATVQSVDGANGGEIGSDVTVHGAIIVDNRVTVGSFKMETGASAGCVMVSNIDGLGSWVAPDGKFWKVMGNTGTAAGTDFIGTTDYVSLNFRVNNERVLRLKKAPVDAGTYEEISSIIGGCSSNAVNNDASGAFVGGGGQSSGNNRVNDHFGVVVGGLDNRANLEAFVGGGTSNIASGNQSVVAGGRYNTAAGNNSSIAGGYNNTTNGTYAFAAGYFCEANGEKSVAMGSHSRAAGTGSVAIGSYAKAIDNGCFVFADNSSTDEFYSGIDNQFKVRAEGGIVFTGGSIAPNIKLKAEGAAATIILDGATGTTTTKVLEITGGSDLAEPFEMSGGGELEPGALVVIDANNPGHTCLSSNAYDHCVAGVISGAGGVNPGLTLSQRGVLDGGQLVALTGRVYCKASAINGAIQPGDLLTTSNIPGHAMKATDPTRSHGTVIGKAMTVLNDGEGLVLVLVNLQ